MRFARILAVALVAVLLAAGTAGAQDVTLSVAVSLKEVTEELGSRLHGRASGGHASLQFRRLG